MNDNNTNITLGGLAKKLVSSGLLSQDEMDLNAKKAIESASDLLEYLVDNKITTSQQIALTAATSFGAPFFDLSAIDNDYMAQLELKPEIIKKHKALPLFKRGDKLFVAIADPTNLNALDDIKFQTNTTPEAIVVEIDKLNKKINDISSSVDLSNFDDLSIEKSELDDSSDFSTIKDDDTPIVKFVNKMLLDAIATGASDLHFEPYEKTYRVRFRTDGILLEHATPPQALAPRISSRLKIMSGLDISERRVPQDGRFKLRLSASKAIDFRISTCPTLFGEKVVMRILDPTSAQIGIDALGFEAFQEKELLKAIHTPQGMVLVTGPTGSGKTVTLYTCLNILNTEEINISTAEDPVEINLAGVNQVNVNTKAGLTFSSILRSFLRQDPDIVMVGEIRDLETAEIATKAAQTGHMVLSTLHTNSAPDTLTRMINMGIPAYNLATSVNLVIAQRLARRLCSKCKEKYNPSESELNAIQFKLEELENATFYKPVGCNACNKGYKGRVGLYEVMVNTDNLKKIILEGGNAIKIKEQALADGMWDLRRSARHKVVQGFTSIEEISRVTQG